jgi:hypothetical protein
VVSESVVSESVVSESVVSESPEPRSVASESSASESVGIGILSVSRILGTVEMEVSTDSPTRGAGLCDFAAANAYEDADVAEVDTFGAGIAPPGGACTPGDAGSGVASALRTPGTAPAWSRRLTVPTAHSARRPDPDEETQSDRSTAFSRAVVVVFLRSAHLPTT